MKERKDSLIFESEVSLSGSQNIFGYFDNLILDLKKEVLREALNSTIFKLKKAENIHDQNTVEECLRLATKISQELAMIKD